MQITLRKANALQAKILEVVKNTPTEGITQVGKFVEPIKAVNDAISELKDNLSLKFELNVILFGIRKAVAAKNAEVGVPDILNEMALVSKQGDIIESIAKVRTFAPDDEAVKAAHADLLKDRPRMDRYDTPAEAINVSLISKETATKYKKQYADLGKQKQNLSDKLLDINIKNEIVLEPTWVEKLKELDIL